jgi:iron complex outermembrane recepter protein
MRFILGKQLLGRRISAAALIGVAIWVLSTPQSPAQQAPEQPAAPAPAPVAAPVEEVVVTGSRIVSPDMVSTSPIATVTKEELQLQGTTDVINLLNNIPQNFQNSAADFSNTSNPLAGPGGITTADLRGLGPQRTLVLVDGKRLGIGDANTGNPNAAPDLDQIPPQLIERIDIVTGGESAIYGSDAIAGVVNFIMRHNFEGVQLDYQYGFDQHHNQESGMQTLLQQAGFAQPPSSVHDGANKDVSIILGTNFDDNRGNITAFANYHDAAPVSQGSRDWSACRFLVLGNVPQCNGSENSNQYITNDNAEYTIVGNRLLPWSQAGSSPPAIFNSSPYQYLARQDTRYSAGYFAHLDLNEHAKVYSDFNFMNDRTTVNVGPSGLFEGGNPAPGSGGAFSVNCNNPLLSAQEVSVLCTPANITPGTNLVPLTIGRRNIEGGPRVGYYEHQNFRFVVGVKGDIDSAWTYDAYGQYYYTSRYNSNSGYVNQANAAQALQVVSVGGVPTCTSTVTGLGNGCVPWNIWTQGGVTQQQLDYLDTVGTAYGTVEERTVDANVVGALGKYGLQLPTAHEGVSLSLGAQYRADAIVWTPDAVSAAGDLAGGSGVVPAVNNSENVRELYSELRVPLLQHVPLADDLILSGAYRRSDYNSVGGVNTFNMGLQWAPLNGYRFRASYARAIRAPNVLELYTPESVTQSLTLSVDPCAGAAPQASLAQCMHTGVTAAQYGHILQCPAGQCGALVGGNSALKPEQANTASVGITLQPQALPGFSASVDYYHIDLTNEVGAYPAPTYVQLCLTTGEPIYCNQIVRTPRGALFGATVAGGGYVLGNNQNLAGAIVSGIDVLSNYHVALGAGRGAMEFSFNGTYTRESQTTAFPGATPYDCAGLYGSVCETVNPKWRHTLRSTYVSPWNWLVSLQWRFIGKVGLDTNDPNTFLNNGSYDSFDAHLPAMSYLDLSGVWEVSHWLTFRAGINNILDKDPPLVNNLVTGTGAPNSYPTYDLLGRQIFANLTLKF